MKVFNANDLRARRVAQNLTLVEFATRTGLSTPTLSRIENGLRLPSVAEVEVLTAALEPAAARPSRRRRSVSVPEVASRYIDVPKRLRVEVSLEDVPTDDKSQVSGKPNGLPVVVFVSLEGLSDGMTLNPSGGAQCDDRGEEEPTKSPRERARG